MEMDKIRVIFILPEDCSDESEAPAIMIQAYESCKQNVVNVSWVEESEFESVDLSKTDFIIFEDFKGKNFETLKNNKCARILGPWCLLICLMEGRPIPNFPWPISNVAMSGCVVSCSHLHKSTKLQIKEKVQLMGGCYSDSLMSTNTHLITESVKSEKYLQAAESNLKIMTVKWVEAVWEASLNKNVHCNNEEFAKYQCLPFHNLTISSTGFPNMEMRQDIAQKVATNGGIFTATLALTKTDVLVVYGVNGVLSQKYKAARSNQNIYCVNVDWINDSITKGYAVPHNLYRVHKGTSTPTKEDAACPDFSVLSAIGNITARRKTIIEETVLSRESPPVTRVSPNKRKGSPNEEIGNLIDGLDIKKAKRAGQYLDGCSVFVAGFKAPQREKLCKILNLSGATRYDEISDRLTHIIVGDPACPEVKIIKSKSYPVSLVSIHWLLESIEKQQAADEENYLISLHDTEKHQFSSPLSQKGLSLLRSEKQLTSNDIAPNTSADNSVENDDGKILMKHYLKSTSKEDETDSLIKLIDADSKFNHMSNVYEQEQRSVTETASQLSGIFQCKKFVIFGFDQEDFECLKQQIESDLGLVMSKSYKGIPDYVVAPIIIYSPIQISGVATVNNLWVTESVEEGEERPIQCYHEPFLISDSGKPLKNCVITTSGYTSYEKTFLKDLIEEMGGICQEQFARITSEAKNILASTHLISFEARGKKYAAALKWRLPVINKEWLFECSRKGQRVPEDDFLVGEAKVSSAQTSKKEFQRTNHQTLTSGESSKNVRTLNTVNLESPLSQRLFAGGGDSDSSNQVKLINKLTDEVKQTKKLGSPQSLSEIKNKRILTPINQRETLNISKSEKTPINQRLFALGADNDLCSQVTPINKLMEEVRKTNLLGTPQTPAMPKSAFDIDTPESPFGAFIRPHLSPKSKKELMRYINCIPDFVPPPARRLSTPLSEVKRRCWAKLLGQQDSQSVTKDQTQSSTSAANEFFNESISAQIDKIPDNCENIENTAAEVGDGDKIVFINTKLKQLEDMGNVFGGTRRGSGQFQATVPSEVGSAKESQPFSVGWDFDGVLPNKKQRIFILSGIDNDVRQALVEKIERLGAHVSDLSSYDPNCTHLLCSKPARNEKSLACMAGGKWILHTSYVDKSIAAGSFLDEEEFEFGNPKSKEKLPILLDKEGESRVQSMYWWRKEISKRGYGAFNDMRAIVVAQKREPIVRVIEAGGGQIVNATPPFDETVHATHCLLEIRSVPDFNVYITLAQRGVLCINTLYISDFLYRTNRDVKDAILPQFSKFYS